MDDSPWELWSRVDPSISLEVDVSDNPVVGILLGADGEPLVEVRERPTVPFGFRLPT